MVVASRPRRYGRPPGPLLAFQSLSLGCDDALLEMACAQPPAIFPQRSRLLKDLSVLQPSSAAPKTAPWADGLLSATLAVPVQPDRTGQPRLTNDGVRVRLATR